MAAVAYSEIHARYHLSTGPLQGIPAGLWEFHVPALIRLWAYRRSSNEDPWSWSKVERESVLRPWRTRQVIGRGMTPPRIRYVRTKCCDNVYSTPLWSGPLTLRSTGDPKLHRRGGDHHNTPPPLTGLRATHTKENITGSLTLL